MANEKVAHLDQKEEAAGHGDRGENLARFGLYGKHCLNSIGLYLGIFAVVVILDEALRAIIGI